MGHDTFSGEEDGYIKNTLSDLERFGITYFSYGLISQEGLLSSYFSHKEWGKLYREKEYNRYDPLFHGIFFSNFPLIVWDALHPFGKEQNIMAQRNEICGIRSGLTIGIKNKKNKNKEILAFGAPLSPKEFYSLINDEAHTKEIYKIMCHFFNFHRSH